MATFVVEGGIRQEERSCFERHDLLGQLGLVDVNSIRWMDPRSRTPTVNHATFRHPQSSASLARPPGPALGGSGNSQSVPVEHGVESAESVEEGRER